MNHKLDLTAIQRPTFELTLLDDNHTTIHVKTPSVAKFREMSELATALEHAEENGQDAVAVIYTFLAGVLSYNTEAQTITAEELPEKYNIDIDAAMLIYKAYIGFLSDIANQKN